MGFKMKKKIITNLSQTRDRGFFLDFHLNFKSITNRSFKLGLNWDRWVTLAMINVQKNGLLMLRA